MKQISKCKITVEREYSREREGVGEEEEEEYKKVGKIPGD